MVRMLEAATLEDVYDAYNHMLVDDANLLSCIGTSGPNPLPAAGTPQQPQARQKRSGHSRHQALLTVLQCSADQMANSLMRRSKFSFCCPTSKIERGCLLIDWLLYWASRTPQGLVWRAEAAHSAF